MSKFNANEYLRFRVPYPESLFKELRSFCGPYCSKMSSDDEPLRVLDLGSGTGFSAQSFLGFYPWAEVTLVEPDHEMLEISRAELGSMPRIRWVNQSAELFEMKESYDLVLIGSAWHWMDRKRIQEKIENSESKAVFIFEYQFPKAKENPSLNEWVRREFNLKWKTTNQVPRGSLIELTEGLRNSSSMRECARVFLPHEQSFLFDDFFGMLISQSRFLAFEQTLLDSQRISHREEVRRELFQFWGLKNENSFLMPYEGLFFQRRRI